MKATRKVFINTGPLNSNQHFVNKYFAPFTLSGKVGRALAMKWSHIHLWRCPRSGSTQDQYSWIKTIAFDRVFRVNEWELNDFLSVIAKIIMPSNEFRNYSKNRVVWLTVAKSACVLKFCFTVQFCKIFYLCSVNEKNLRKLSFLKAYLFT